MMTCRELAELLHDFEADELPTDHRVRVERHLHRCSACVAYLESYRLIIQLPQRLPPPALPAEVGIRLRAILDENCMEGESSDPKPN